MNLPATGRAFRPLSSGFQGALLILVLLTAVSSASAAITFDNATASKAKNNTSEISWKHTIGGGADAAEEYLPRLLNGQRLGANSTNPVARGVLSRNLISESRQGRKMAYLPSR